MYIKCPRCGLNYMKDEDKLCAICISETSIAFLGEEVCEVCGAILEYNEYKICTDCLSK